MNEMELQTTLEPIEMDMGDPEIEYSPVFPNPEGEPTDDLTKVQIQGNIYQIKDPEVHEWARDEEKPTYTKAEVGLGNVDNTSDMDKPVSTATQNALDGKVDNSELGNYYTKSEVNSALDNKADKSDTYTKTETDNLLSEKADSSSVYTKTETDTALGNKVDKVSGKGLSTNDYDDTAKGIVEGVTSALDNKVDKDGDKVLSDNNYSDTDKTKLGGIEAEANKTIVDNSVTATSTNPVESKAIYNLLNDLLPEGEATGNPISISNASGFNAKALTVDMLPIQDLHGYDKPWAGGSGKNKIDIANGTGATTRGVTPSYDNNGGLNFVGTPTGTGYIGNWALTNPLVLPAGTYTISFSESIDKPFILLDNWTSIAYIPRGNNSYTVNFANGVSINRIALSASSEDVDVPLSINIGKIQIEAGSSATSYEPYSNICPISGRSSLDVTVNGKNLLEITSSSTTINGITYTVNSDGTVLVNGTATANSAFSLINNEGEQKLVNMDSTFTLNGCPSGGSTTGYRLQWYLYETGKTATDTGNGVTFKPLITNGNLSIVVSSGTTCNNLIFKPMIRISSISDDTYEPYKLIDTETINLGETVYGGTCDVVGGGRVMSGLN